MKWGAAHAFEVRVHAKRPNWVLSRIVDSPPNQGDGLPTLPPSYEFYLFRSENGVDWSEAELPPADYDRRLLSLGYGAGTFLLTQEVTDGAHYDILVSRTAADWMSTGRYRRFPAELPVLRHVEGRYYSLTQPVLASVDAHDWEIVADDARGRELLFGNGVYVLGTYGTLRASRDGLEFGDVMLTCGTSPCLGTLVFGDGHFFSGQRVSIDGVVWEPTELSYPQAYLGGRFLRPNRSVIESWTLAGDHRETSVDAAPSPLPEGVDCTTHRCVLLFGELYLIP
jgi:hypothetical protein